MRYCPNCYLLAEDECPQCGGRLREPRENDPVLLASVGVVHAAMLEPMLEEAEIPYSRMGTVGAAFAMAGGMATEQIRIFVPCGAYERARELVETVVVEGDIIP